MYLKRNNIAKFWPIPRKGTKYLAYATHNQKESIPIVVVLRDILKLVKNKKELQRLLNERKIIINHKKIFETNFPVSLFDIIQIPDMKKNYKAIMSKNKKIIFEEISEKEAATKIYKVLNKRVLGNKKIQINLMHGKNILSNEKVNIGDSIQINLKDNMIVKIIPFEKGKKANVIEGKHAGYTGKIEEIVERGGKVLAKISSEKERINVWVKNIIVSE